MPRIIPPRTSAERELVLIWEQVLQHAPIGIQEDFFDLGGTSVQAARIFARIEKAFHKRLPLSVIMGAPTIEKLAAALVPGNSWERNAYAVPMQCRGERPIFFCVGEGILWRQASEHLGPDQPVFNLWLKREALAETKGPHLMEKLARRLVAALCEKQSQGPYFLGGFCRDAVFAYEVARQLQLYGHEVGLLVLIEPSTPYQAARARFATTLRRITFRVSYRLGELRRLGFAEFPRYAHSRWNGLKATLSALLWRRSARRQAVSDFSSPSDSERLLFVATSSYKPKPLACPTAIFRCKDWPMLSAGDSYFGWREMLTGRSETHEVPGDHKGMFGEPNVEVFAKMLRTCLQNARQSEASDYDMIVDGN